MKEKLIADAFLSNNVQKVFFEIKNNIIKEIVRVSNCVSIDYLSKNLRENEDKIENWVLLGIRNNTLKACIDDIDRIVYSKETKPINEVINKCFDTTKEIYHNSLLRLTDRLVKKILKEFLEETLILMDGNILR